MKHGLLHLVFMVLGWLCGYLPASAALLDLSLHKVPLTEVLFQLARHNGLNMVVHGSIEGSASINLQQIEVRQALRLLCENHGLECRQQQQTLLVRPITGALPAPSPTRHLQSIKLNYATAEQVRQVLVQAPGLLSERGFLVADARAGKLLLYDQDDKLALLRQAIAELDQPL
jgi:type II secretory pathway component HofQ